jgi:hypothetical protein
VSSDLIELERIKQVIELPVLLPLFNFDEMLLQPVKSQLRLVVDINFKRLQTDASSSEGKIAVHKMTRPAHVLHELLADGPDLLAQRGAKHHDLLRMRCSEEHLLNVAAHVCGNKM